MKINKIKILICALIVVITVPIIVFLVSPFLVLDVYRGDDEKTIWARIWGLPFKKEISGTNSYKALDLQWSPDKLHLAFFDFVREEIYNKEWFLRIYSPRFFQVKTVFIGDWRTSEYKWINNNTIRVYVSAGSGVRIFRDIDIGADKAFVADNYQSPAYWTPEKTF